MISNELLKKKILDEAIHGRLVENDPSLKPVDVQSIDKDIPFEIPSNWKWIYFGDLAECRMGKTILSENLVDNGIPVYSATQENKVFGFVKSSELILYKGDLVIPARGNSIGYATYIFDKEATCTQTTICCKNIKILSKYLYFCCYAFKDIWFKFTGAAIPQITVKQLNKNLVPVPPLEEQEKIVKKIEELFELIDKKEKNDQEKEKLKTLLKEKILDSAIRGQLVENDLSLPVIDVEEIKDNIPFEIPNNWRWCYYENIGYSGIGLTYKPDNITNNGMIVLRSSNIQNGKLDLKDIVRVDCKVNDNIIVNENDILICARNGSKRLIGKSCLLNNLSEKMTYGAFMTIFRTPYYKYVYWFMQSKYYYNQLYENTNTMTINQITQKKLKSLLLPIPPLEQQKRIVEKIEKCFELIEQL